MLQIFLISLISPVTTLPCEIQKSYFSNLQQYDNVRNVIKKLLRRFPKHKVDFICFTDEETFIANPPRRRKMIEHTIKKA